MGVTIKVVEKRVNEYLEIARENPLFCWIEDRIDWENYKKEIICQKEKDTVKQGK